MKLFVMFKASANKLESFLKLSGFDFTVYTNYAPSFMNLSKSAKKYSGALL